jgi:anti-anti-sigma factor
VLGIFRTRVPRTFRVEGAIDLATGGQLVEFLREELLRDGDLTLDLSGLSFVDSIGLRAFVELAQALEGRGRLILRSPPEPVRRSLEISGLERLPGVDVLL